MSPLGPGVVVAHCDWSTHVSKRWVAVGEIHPDGAAVAEGPQPVGDARTLLDRLRAFADGRSVVVGFDFPIGLPWVYAQRVGVGRFRAFLEQLADGAHPTFFKVAETPERVSPARPFYPAVPKGSRRQDLLDGLGVASMQDLLRVCERATATRSPAASLFWLVGGNQVGKAAIAGWRDILLASIADDDVGLWPFDGPLGELTESRNVVIAETYPAEFYRQLEIRTGVGGKKEQQGRLPACTVLADRVATLSIALSVTATAALADGFGEGRDGEDRFDAFVGLIGMLNILLGHRDSGPPNTIPAEAVAVEGWMLGQGADLPATMVSPVEQLASLIARRNTIDEQIARLIGRPALAGHLGEFIAAEVFDIGLRHSAVTPGHDGVFNSGPLAGATVNVKLYGKREGLLDIPASLPDHILVLCGPRSMPVTSRGASRPLLIDEVFLFDAPALVVRLQQRGVAIGVATSVRSEEWEAARIWPVPTDRQPSLRVTEQQDRLLRLFASSPV